MVFFRWVFLGGFFWVGFLMPTLELNNVAFDTIVFHWTRRMPFRVRSLFFPSSVVGQLQCWCLGCPVGNGGNGAGRLSHGEKAGVSAAQVVCRVQVRSIALSTSKHVSFKYTILWLWRRIQIGIFNFRSDYLSMYEYLYI